MMGYINCDRNHVEDYLLCEVEYEIESSNKKFGEQNHSPAEWLAILGEEFGEAAKEVVEASASKSLINKTTRYKNLRKELIQTACVALKMVQSLDRNELEGQK